MKWIYLAFSLLPGLAIAQTGQGVVINEFMASNDSLSGIADPSGSYADWIELYNNNSSLVNLAGFFLSDDYIQPDKFLFPVGAQIEADGYVIIWADKDLNEEGLHADFKLNKDGEQLILLNNSGEVLDSLTFGPQETNVSYARIPNGTGEFTMRAPTFSSNNDDSSSSVARLVQESIFCYPNPTTTELFIEWPAETGLTPNTWQLVDATGRTFSLQPDQNGSHTFRIDLSSIPVGTYNLWIGSERHFFVKKVLVIR